MLDLIDLGQGRAEGTLHEGLIVRQSLLRVTVAVPQVIVPLVDSLP